MREKNLICNLSIDINTEGDNVKEVLELLIKNGVDPNLLDIAHDSALNVAVVSENEAAVDLLLKHEQNLNRLVKNGTTPLHNAASMGGYFSI